MNEADDTWRTTDVAPFRINQTRGRTISFRGQTLASESGRMAHGSQQTRWTELTLYRTLGDKYVLHIDYRTLWEGEDNNSVVHVCDSPKAVYEALLDGEGELGRMDVELLRAASCIDEAFEPVITEEVG